MSEARRCCLNSLKIGMCFGSLIMVTFLVIIILIVTRPVEDYQQFERLKLETPIPPVRKIAYNLRVSHPVFDSLVETAGYFNVTIAKW